VRKAASFSIFPDQLALILLGEKAPYREINRINQLISKGNLVEGWHRRAGEASRHG
jgi:hypothetical protein